jgi:hypothetical protein
VVPKTALVAGGLLVALVAGFAMGRAVADEPAAGQTAAPTAIPSHTHPGPTGGTDLAGTSLSTGGYTLVPAQTAFQAGVTAPFTFRVIGPDRRPVTGFAVAQDKTMHLIVVRRDLTGYQHLHPEMAPDGTWSIPLTLPAPGSYHAYADFVAGPDAASTAATTLGVDLVVPGDYRPAGLPAPARDVTVDRFTITYEGTPQASATQPITVRVYAAGSPVTGLERYLGAYGHLVVLREGDLAYLHVHPDEQLTGGAVKFWLATPSAGRYRAYFEFQVAGAVHRAEFTLSVG